MAPYQLDVSNTSFVDDFEATRSASLLSNDAIINLVIGICALAVSIVTVWQGQRLWQRRQHILHHNLFELEGKTSLVSVYPLY